MDNNEFQELDEFLAYLQQLPRSKAQVLNPKRWLTFQRACAIFEKIAQSQDGDLSVEANFPLGYGAIQLECDELIFQSEDTFFLALHGADNLEIYPLTSGRMRVALMFYQLTRSI